ncbi:CASP-like protein [Musa troglodytarum]|uniref:CASP-like protein n=1 Tax=Musa troglodytarum TaxID=320322 RepID=A0A9E7JB54_9LILI|nr:CASP-like protein [Musa troglodytarum]
MGAAKEHVTSPDSFDDASVTFPKIKSVNSAAFVYFIIANVLVLVYSIASLALSFVNRAASKGFELALSLADVVMLAFLFTSNGAASAIILVAEQGQARFFWTKFICGNASGFCARVKAAIVLSMFAAVAYLLLVFLKLLVLQKKSQ